MYRVKNSDFTIQFGGWLMFSYEVKNGVGGVVISFIGRLDTLGVSAHESEIMDIVDNSNNVIFVFF